MLLRCSSAARRRALSVSAPQSRTPRISVTRPFRCDGVEGEASTLSRHIRASMNSPARRYHSPRSINCSGVSPPVTFLDVYSRAVGVIGRQSTTGSAARSTCIVQYSMRRGYLSSSHIDCRRASLTWSKPPALAS